MRCLRAKQIAERWGIFDRRIRVLCEQGKCRGAVLLLFAGIHLFIDGNGRTGRLILNFMLMQHGYPPINVKYADRQRYYAAFDAFYRDGDAGAMVWMVGEDVEKRFAHGLLDKDYRVAYD